MKLENINSFNLKREGNKSLTQLHHRCHQWWANPKINRENIINAHIFILQEILRRNLKFDHHIVDDLDKQTLKLLQTKGPKKLLAFFQETLSPLERMAEEMTEFIYVPDFICLTGSTVYHKPDREPNDIDIVVRWSEPSSVISERLENIIPGCEPIWEARGPNWDHIPLYDLVVVPAKKDRVVSESVKNSSWPDGFDYDFDAIESIREKCPDEIIIHENFAAIGGDHFESGAELTCSVCAQPDPMCDLKLQRQILKGTDCVPEFVYPTEAKGELSYNLVLKKCPRSVSSMREPEFKERLYESVTAGRFFKPMKSAKGYREAETTDVKELYETWARGYFERDLKIGAEVKFDGIRMVIHKHDSTVKFFTEDKPRDRSHILPEVADAVKKLPGSFVIDTEVVWWKEGKPLPRRDMAAFFAGKEPIRDEDIHINAFDMLYHDGKDISGLDLKERQAKLNKLLPGASPKKSYRDFFYFSKPIIVSNEKELVSALKTVSAFPGSEGSMLKVQTGPASKYDTTGKRTQGWAKFKIVRETAVQVIGRYKKPESFKNAGISTPSSPVTGSAASDLFKRLTKPSKTYIYRCAFSKAGKMQSVDANKTLTESDLQLRYIPTGATDPVTNQKVKAGEWRGSDDPGVWEMKSGFPERKAGEIAYGNTYAIALDPPAKLGDVITVQPVLFRKFKDKSGKERITWTFPAVRNLEPKGHKPDTYEFIQRFVEAADMTREEEQAEHEKLVGDYYMVEQKGDKTVPWVLQEHIRGVIAPKGLKAAKSELRRILKLTESERQKPFEEVWRDNGLAILKSNFDDLKKSAQRASDQKGDVSAAIKKHLDSKPPKFATFQRLWNRNSIVTQGNSHGDLRILDPSGESLIGWTLDSPGAVLQWFKTGAIKDVLRNKFTQNEPKDNIVSQKKQPQPIAWRTLVTPQKTRFWSEPGTVGATKETAGLFILLAQGKAIFGTQKSDYHEYFFITDYVAPDISDKSISGRWGVQIINPKAQLDKAPSGQFWIFNHPVEQRPYIFTHDYEKEVSEAKKDKIDLVWNFDAIGALKNTDYFKNDEMSKAFTKFEASGRNKKPKTNVVQNRKKPVEKVKPQHSSDLAKLQQEIKLCTSCPLCRAGGPPVPGAGNSDADVMLVGEAPGAQEIEQGKPFVGKAGQFLDKILADMNIDRDKLYITNVVKCRPPGNRTPRAFEVTLCGKHLDKEIELVLPNMIVALGKTASNRLENIKFPEINIINTIHPSAAMLSDDKKQALKKDLSRIKEYF